jgi:hypothetical protein
LIAETGLVMAALNACIPTVHIVITNTEIPANANIHQYRGILYSKLLSQWYINHQDSGKAMQHEMPVNISMPTSFARFIAPAVAKFMKLIQAMIVIISDSERKNAIREKRVTFQ